MTVGTSSHWARFVLRLTSLGLCRLRTYHSMRMNVCTIVSWTARSRILRPTSARREVTTDGNSHATDSVAHVQRQSTLLEHSKHFVGPDNQNVSDSCRGGGSCFPSCVKCFPDPHVDHILARITVSACRASRLGHILHKPATSLSSKKELEEDFLEI